MARPFWNGAASACAVAAGAWIVFDPVGDRDRKICLAAAAVLSATAGDHRSIYRRSAKTAGECFRVGKTSARRLRDRRGRRFSRRRVDRMVAQRRVLGTPGPAIHRAVAGDGMASVRVLHLSVELEREHVPDCARDRISGHGADLVRRGERQQCLLRRGANPWCQAIVPGAESRDSGGATARLRRPVHGPRVVLRRAGGRRNDRRQGRSWLVSAVGPGLGSLFEHVCRADRNVAVVLGRDHAAVLDTRPAAGLAKGRREMVALATADRAAPAVAGASLYVEAASPAFDSDGAVLPVLDDISFSVKPGEFVALLGPSGCGKSTLLRLAAGLEPPRSGSLREDGDPIRGPFPSRVVVFQDPTLFPWRTVWNNVALGLEAQGILKSQRHRVDAAIDLVGLSAFRNAYPHQLSGGMAQRVALARALVNDPRILILDEPLGKLDSLTRITMQAEIASLQRTGFTALLVTHDVEEAVFLANRVIVFSDRPARIKADIAVDRPYPRHRGDPKLAELRREILGLLGLGATW